MLNTLCFIILSSFWIDFLVQLLSGSLALHHLAEDTWVVYSNRTLSIRRWWIQMSFFILQAYCATKAKKKFS